MAFSGVEMKELQRQYRAGEMPPEDAAAFERSFPALAKPMTREEFRARGTALTEPNAETPPINLRAGLESALSTAATMAIPGAGPVRMIGRALAAGGGAAAGSLASEPFQPSESPGTQAAISGGIGLLGQLIPEAVVGGVKQGARAIGRALGIGQQAPGAAAAKAVVEDVGGRLTPAQQSGAPLLQKLEHVSESSLLGTGAIGAVKQDAKTRVQGAIQAQAQGFATHLSREEAGQAFQGALEGTEEAWRSSTRGAYKAIDTALETEMGQQYAVIDLRPVKAEAQRLMPGAHREEMGYLRQKLQHVLKLPDTLRFDEAHDLRSDWMDITRGAYAPGQIVTGAQVKAKGPIRSLTKTLHAQMEEGAKEGNVYELWRTADTMHGEGATFFNQAVVRQIARSTPDAVVDLIAKNNRPYQIRTLREQIKDPEAWQAVQGAWMERLMQHPSIVDAATGEVSGKALVRELTRVGDDAMSELFPTGTGATMKRLGHTLAFLQDTPGGAESARNMVVKLGIGGLLIGGPIGAAALTIAPAAMGKALANPTIANLLLKGVNLPAMSAEGAALNTRIGALLAKEGLMDRQPEEP